MPDTSRMCRRCFVGLLVLHLVAWTSLVPAAEVEIADGTRKGEKVVSISGPIESGDLDKIRRQAAIVIQDNEKVVLRLNSKGGDVLEAIKIGRFARELLAKTVVRGNTFYTRETARGREIENFNRKMATEFGLGIDDLRHVAKHQPVPDEDIVSCYSACVLIFFGGAFRDIYDNLDTRYQPQSTRAIPVVGLHRPYFEKKRYASTNPASAQKPYAQLETLVRDYMREMGATTALIDRMFRTPSDQVDLIPKDEFKKHFQHSEPFIDEWLKAKCGGLGPANVLNQDEQLVYERYRRSYKNAAMKKGDILDEEEFLGSLPPEFREAKVRGILEKLRSTNARRTGCQTTAIWRHQLNYLE